MFRECEKSVQTFWCLEPKPVHSGSSYLRGVELINFGEMEADFNMLGVFSIVFWAVDFIFAIKNRKKCHLPTFSVGFCGDSPHKILTFAKNAYTSM